MSCYFRHIKDILQEAGISVNPENKKPIDRAIHEIVGSSYKDCPETWRKIKQELIGNEQNRQKFIDKLKESI